MLVLSTSQVTAFESSRYQQDGIKAVWTTGWLNELVEVDKDWLEDGIFVNGMY